MACSGVRAAPHESRDGWDQQKVSRRDAHAATLRREAQQRCETKHLDGRGSGGPS